MELNVLLGIFGLILILLAFILNLIHKFNSKSKGYLLMNIIGSGFLAYYALILESMPFFILQIVWGASSLIKLAFVLRKK